MKKMILFAAGFFGAGALVIGLTVIEAVLA